MGRLEGKVAIITGGARGQGRSHALKLASEGADIVALDVDADIASLEYALGTDEQLKETVKGVEELDRRALGLVADVRSQEQMDGVVAKALDEFGKVDILVVNHGIWGLRPFWELSETEWQDMVDVNLTGVFHAVKAVTPHMIEREDGAIVITGSVNAIEPAVDYAHYCATKAGAEMFSRNVALELGRFGIRCNMVCPSATDTDIIKWQGALDRFVAPGATVDDLRDGMKHFTGLKGRRLMRPEAMSDAVAFLVSDDARDITGITLPVDGGHLIQTGHNHNPG
ncbi:MAG: mycofactocin-coupled SDR family oxidoreductase [Gordonia sp. (in: high G+C Gram-positive bacteria)]